MSLTIPPYPRLLTPLTIGFGMIVFLWFSPDDPGWGVIALGVGSSALIAAHGVFRLGGRTVPVLLWLPGCLALGGLVGAGAAVATAALMLLKTGLHGHIFPDYPLAVIVGILSRLPAWAGAGALVGLTVALLIPVLSAPSAAMRRR